MALLITFLIMLVLAAAAWIVRGRAFLVATSADHEKSNRDYGGDPVLVKKTWRTILLWATIGLVLIGLVSAFYSVFRKVGTKEEGIGLVYGKTHGRYGPGPHITWPWVSIKEMDAAVQTDTYDDEKAIPVRIANQQTGHAALSFQWRIRKNAVDSLYQNYRSFDHVRDALVTRRLFAAVNEALSNYNPLASITVGAKQNTSYADLDQRITKIMRREVGGRIVVLSTVIKIIHYDDATQQRINQLQQQVAQTAIAIQEQRTNKEKATANNKLAKSVDTSPNVLVARCLDILDNMVKAGQSVPAGFTCWPGDSKFAGVIATDK